MSGLSRIVSALVFVAVLLWAAWVAPVSPLALSRGDLALAAGDPWTAAGRYDAVARSCPVTATRQQALRRAAAVYETELGDPATATDRLASLLQTPLDDGERARVHASIGRLALQQHQPQRAARSWLKARQLQPGAPEQASWSASAAAAMTQAGQHKAADNVWAQLVREHPDWRAEANLQRAALALSRGQPTEALALYDDVIATGGLDQRTAAKLGASLCLERLGDLAGAIAALDDSELPEAVQRDRTASLRSRQAWTP